MKGCGEDKRCTVFAHLFFDSTGSIHVNEPLTRRRRAMPAHLPDQEGRCVAGIGVNHFRTAHAVSSHLFRLSETLLVRMLHGKTDHASACARACRQGRIPLPRDSP